MEESTKSNCREIYLATNLYEQKSNFLRQYAQGANINPTIETMSKIAKALNVGVDDLLK